MTPVDEWSPEARAAVVKQLRALADAIEKGRAAVSATVTIKYDNEVVIEPKYVWDPEPWKVERRVRCCGYDIKLKAKVIK